MTNRQHEKKITKRKKTKRQRPTRGFNIVTSGQFCTLAMFVLFTNNFYDFIGIIIGLIMTIDQHPHHNFTGKKVEENLFKVQ